MAKAPKISCFLRPWALYAIISAALITATSAVLLIWLAPDWHGTLWFSVLDVIFGLVFVLVMSYNPAWWYRRWAAWCFRGAVVTGAIPTVAAGFQWGETTVSPSGYFLLQGSTLLPIALVIAGGVLAYIDARSKTPQGSGDDNRSIATESSSVQAGVINAPIDQSQNTTIYNNVSHIREAVLWVTFAVAACGFLIWGLFGIEDNGGRSSDVDGDINDSTIIQGDNITIETDPKLIETNSRLVEMLQREQEEKRLTEQELALVEKALERLEASDAKSREAVKNALQQGDLREVKRALLELANPQGQDYVELCREIATVAYITGDIEEAEKRLNIILAHDPADVNAINRLGNVFMLRGEFDQAEVQYKRSLELSSPESSDMAAAYGNLGLLAETRGDPDGAEKLHYKALYIERRLGRLAGQAIDLGNLGNLAQKRGDLDAAGKLYREALDINRKLKHLPGQAINLGNLGNLAEIRGDVDGAEKLYHEALGIERKLGRLEGQAINLGSLGNLAEIRGDVDGAEKLHREALDINRKLEHLEGQAINLGNLGILAETRGDLDGAERLHRAALDIDRKLGRLEGQAVHLCNLGILAKMRGDLDGAEKLHRKALDIDRKLGYLAGQADNLGNLGLLAEMRGDLDRAEKLYHESLNIERKLGRLEGQASDLGNLGILAETRGDLDAAEKLYREALDINRKLGHLEGQAINLSNLGNLVEKRGDGGQARTYWEKAKELFERAGMSQHVDLIQGWIDELDDQAPAGD